MLQVVLEFLIQEVEEVALKEDLTFQVVKVQNYSLVVLVEEAFHLVEVVKILVVEE
jgi:hypothetical protein